MGMMHRGGPPPMGPMGPRGQFGGPPGFVFPDGPGFQSPEPQQPPGAPSTTAPARP